MMKTLPLLVIAFLATGAAADKTVNPFVHGVPQQRVPGVGLIKLHGVSPESLVVASSKAGGDVLKQLSARTGVDVTLIRPVALGWAFVNVRAAGSARVPTESETLALLDAVAADSAVKAVSEDKWMRALAIPNDPGLDQMWHFDIINAQAAWDITQGLSSQRVGVIDTGLVRDHEDVGFRATGGFDFVSTANAGNDGNGRDNDFDDPGDDCGQGDSFHGTHVAGTIGAAADNNTGVVGLNWNAGLVIGRALGRCGGDIVDIGEAAVWLAGGSIDGVPAVGANRVSVMNLSLGSDSVCSSFEQDVVDFVDGQGTVFVAAAGNSAGPVGSPANCTGVVSVAAHGPDRSLTNYSSFGNEVEIVAPGGDFSFGNSFGVLSSVGPVSDGYTFQQGTSMAAPHVAGSISLMQALDPGITRTEIVTIMQTTGVACTGCGTKRALVLDDALAAVDTTQPPPPPPPPPAGEDDLEENDSFDQAKTGPQCGDNVSLFAAAGDQDWFLLETVPGESIDIAISALNGADLDLYVLTGPNAEDIIAASETATGNESVHVDADGTTLHILVNPFIDQNGFENTGAYSFDLDCVGGPDEEEPVDPEPPVGPNPEAEEDTLEPNNDLANASELFCDETKDATLRDDDVFAIEVRDGDTLTAEVNASGLEMETAILDVSGNVLSEGSAVARAEDLAEGVYVIRLRPVDGAVGTYRLRGACNAPGELDDPIIASGGCSSTSSSAPLAALGIVLVAMLRRRRR